MMNAANDSRMVSDQSLFRESAIHKPAILTLDIQARLATINAACRELRKLGLRIQDQDVAPNDDGAPLVDLGPILPHQAEQVISAAGGSTHNAATQRHSASVFGVRAIWTIPQ